MPARVRTPAVLQIEAVECGAASLAMVLRYFGRNVPLAALRRQCGVSRDGSKASNIVKAARHYGLNAKGYSKPVAQVQQLQPPFIIYWNFNHFVTCEGFDPKKDRVYINDPAVGHRAVTFAEFDRAYTGVVLVFEKGPEFQPGGRLPSPFLGISERLAGSSKALAFCVLAGFLLVLPGLAMPAFNQVFIDSIVLEGRRDWLRPLVLAMSCAVLAQGILHYLQMRYLRRLKIKLSIQLSSKYLWHLLQLPASFYAQRYAGEIANRSTLNDKLAGLLSGQLAQTAIDVVMMVFYGALMLWYDVGLTLMAVAFAGLNALLLTTISKQREETNMRVLQEYGKAQGVAMAGLQSIETLKASGLESGMFAQWAGYYAKATNARQELEFSNRWLNVVPALLTGLTTLSLLTFGGLRVINGELTIGMLIAMQSLMGSFLAPINAMVNLGGVFQELRGDLDRVDDVLMNETVPTPLNEEIVDEHGVRITRLDGYVELRDLTYGYSPLDPPLFDSINIRIAPGQRVALVGGSGSGKSTLGKLISGEYLPWSGEVLFDDRPRNTIPADVMRNSLAVVDQDINLFEGNLRENLTLWDTTVRDQVLVDACRDAVAWPFVSTLVGGFDAVLSEGGVNLSGGQRQRLEIARALVHNPAILIFDEATSALDAESEALVMANLRTRGCTAVMIAHRLSTVMDCDEIIVLERGRIVERGTHEDLWQADGAYARLMRADQEPTLEEQAEEEAEADA
ncbi:MAG: NHLP family bacteriocin export ABC transporter peptidase/permease/ATPase subunit [Gammaproteobacteria bacterium]|nr:NHLP family bacteriocin export ABC transporter peptidase/permease/ATPase subunit [Gammaproteobacteria bacterium]MBI5616884.1 NHLP family bacteriocin export ABC transporter peptidase/permease/ATPase subunit [Gammaproteobacteria bacterium]